jgi:hypothetical protein
MLNMYKFIGGDIFTTLIGAINVWKQLVFDKIFSTFWYNLLLLFWFTHSSIAFSPEAMVLINLIYVIVIVDVGTYIKKK